MGQERRQPSSLVAGESSELGSFFHSMHTYMAIVATFEFACVACMDDDDDDDDRYVV